MNQKQIELCQQFLQQLKDKLKELAKSDLKPKSNSVSFNASDLSKLERILGDSLGKCTESSLLFLNANSIDLNLLNAAAEQIAQHINTVNSLFEQYETVKKNFNDDNIARLDRIIKSHLTKFIPQKIASIEIKLEKPDLNENGITVAVAFSENSTQQLVKKFEEEFKQFATPESAKTTFFSASDPKPGSEEIASLLSEDEDDDNSVELFPVGKASADTPDEQPGCCTFIQNLFRCTR